MPCHGKGKACLAEPRLLTEQGRPPDQDDLALICEPPSELQSMLDIVASYASLWRYHINAQKCVIMVLGKSLLRPVSTTVPSILGSFVPLFQMWLSSNIWASFRQSILQQCTKQLRDVQQEGALFSLNMAGSRFGCLHPLTSLSLYSSFSLMLYGCEL